MMKWTGAYAAAMAVLAVTPPSRVAAGYLSTADEMQVAAWSGVGDRTFTDLFSARSGDGGWSHDFHAATGPRGSLTLIRVMTDRPEGPGGFGEGTTQLGGGYASRGGMSPGGSPIPTRGSGGPVSPPGLAPAAFPGQQSNSHNSGRPGFGPLPAQNGSGSGSTSGGQKLPVNGRSGTASGVQSSPGSPTGPAPDASSVGTLGADPGMDAAFEFSSIGTTPGPVGNSIPDQSRLATGGSDLNEISRFGSAPGIGPFGPGPADPVAATAPSGLVLGLVGAATVLLPLGVRRLRAALAAR